MDSAPSSQTIRLQYIGPVFFGGLLNWCLLGTSTVQLYNFHVRFPKERTSIKCFVYILYILDLAQTVGSTHYSYYVLVSGWGDLSALAAHTWSIAIVPIWSGLIVLFLENLDSDTKQPFISGLRGDPDFCSTSSVVELVGSVLIQLIIKFALAANTTALASMSSLAEVWLIGSFVCDIAITLAMLFVQLGSMRHKSHWDRT
ncbi:hypothetical protein F5146DRAFT_1130744 [Armillaria mellea]|nr:hypothetical protein F5146DRAFT_1130744 [Armillaria mellea]